MPMLRPSVPALAVALSLAALAPSSRADEAPAATTPPAAEVPAPAPAATPAPVSDGAFPGAAADPGQAPAATPPKAPLPAGRIDEPLWELGAFGFGSWQPAYPGSDTHLNRWGALPYATYRGRIVRLEGGALGLRAVHTPRWEWDLTGSFSFGGSADKVSARAGMPSIGTLAGAGPALRVNLGDLDQGPAVARATRLDLPLRGIFDLNDQFRFKGWAFEPTIGHAWQDASPLSFKASAGLLFGDQQLNRLFYGVDPAYATATRPAYAAKAGLIATRLNAGVRYRVSPTLRLYGALTWETVRGAANEDSPLVRRKQDLDVGIGLIWVFRQSEARAAE